MEEAAFSGELKEDGCGEGVMSDKAEKYLNILMKEKQEIPMEFKHATRLLQMEIDNILNNGDARIKHRFVDLFHNRMALVSNKICLPTKEFPKFNFVGKLLGPKGNTLKRLQEETKCRMVILGRGSVKDKEKEEALRASNDKKFVHLLDDLHVEVSAFAQPAEAHARMAYGLAELRKYIIPDNNDEISEQQARELGFYQGPGDRDTKSEGYFPPQRRDNPPLLMEPTFGQSNPPQNRGGHNAGMRGWGGGQRGRRGSSHGHNTNQGGNGGTLGPIASFCRENDISLGSRGRSGNSGRNHHNRDDYYDSGYARGENINNQGYQSMGYEDGGGYPPLMGGDDDFNGGEYSRRGNFHEKNYGQESGRGQWKQRGGVSRFGERSAPYSRRY